MKNYDQECQNCEHILELIDERNRLKHEIRELKKQKEAAELNLETVNRKVADLLRKNTALKRKIYEDGGMVR